MQFIDTKTGMKWHQGLGDTLVIDDGSGNLVNVQTPGSTVPAGSTSPITGGIVFDSGPGGQPQQPGATPTANQVSNPQLTGAQQVQTTQAELAALSSITGAFAAAGGQIGAAVLRGSTVSPTYPPAVAPRPVILTSTGQASAGLPGWVVPVAVLAVVAAILYAVSKRKG